MKRVVESLSNASRLRASAMTEKSIGIVSFEDFQRRTNVGSSRIRVQWLLNYWPEAELFRTGRKYEVVIFQKAYWLQYAEAFEGIKILDVCEPHFLNWRSNVKRMIDCCDAVTASSEALVDVLEKYTSRPVRCIPDRLDPHAFGGMWKNHTGRGRAKCVAWYGYSHNFAALDSIIDVLPELGIEELVVIADEQKPYYVPVALAGKLCVRNLAWGPDSVSRDLLKADIVINPTMHNGRWKYKSNNKTLTAWAIGLPVAHTRDELAALMPEEARVRDMAQRRYRLFDEYHVRRSVDQYRRLIDDVKSQTSDPVTSFDVVGIPDSYANKVAV